MISKIFTSCLASLVWFLTVSNLVYAAPIPDFGALPIYKLDPALISDSESKNLENLSPQKDIQKYCFVASRACARFIYKGQVKQARVVLVKLANAIEINPNLVNSQVSRDITLLVALVAKSNSFKYLDKECSRLAEVTEKNTSLGIQSMMLTGGRKKNSVSIPVQRIVDTVYRFKKERLPSKNLTFGWLNDFVELAEFNRDFEEAAKGQARLVAVFDDRDKRFKFDFDELYPRIKLIRLLLLSHQRADAIIVYRSILKFFANYFDSNFELRKANTFAEIASISCSTNQLDLADKAIRDSITSKNNIFDSQKHAVNLLINAYIEKKDYRRATDLLTYLVDRFENKSIKKFYLGILSDTQLKAGIGNNARKDDWYEESASTFNKLLSISSDEAARRLVKNRKKKLAEFGYNRHSTSFNSKFATKKE